MAILSKWKGTKSTQDPEHTTPSDTVDEKAASTKKWSLGILADPHTDEVPGSVILLSSAHKRNEPLGLQHAHARTSSSSLPSPYGPPNRSSSRGSRFSSRSRPLEKKRTKDGKFILDPQPDDSANDPLNWSKLRRDVALLSLGFYCMIGGGMTPLLAAGFNDVAKTYNVTVPQVALTTGFYMLGLGLGSVVVSPTAILFGKRPVYLIGIIVFLLSAVWCALSPNYSSLVVARIFQGFAVSPVECLPSATVAEIFFLHERAYRLGIYTLLLLGGKNLIPLVSAAIINSLGWRWVFWMVAIVVGFCFFLIFFFVPETFWDRTPTARERRRSRSHLHLPHLQRHSRKSQLALNEDNANPSRIPTPLAPPTSGVDTPGRPNKAPHVEFAVDNGRDITEAHNSRITFGEAPTPHSTISQQDYFGVIHRQDNNSTAVPDLPCAPSTASGSQGEQGHRATVETAHGQKSNDLTNHPELPQVDTGVARADPEKQAGMSPYSHTMSPGASQEHIEEVLNGYTDYYRAAPPKSYVQSLKPWNGRLTKDKWVHVMIRPFVLFAYPAVLWSSMTYALAVGWLIVLSESVAHIYETRDTYNFTPLQVGLVYISPFVGGVLGTAVAGKISDIIVRFMARRNDGVYEPEFRLVMAIPIALSTTVGLMGFGWSAQEKDNWIVPTIFFGIISFGCSLASTTAVTFVVDSYRVYAGEALVTLNFCKNVLHGFLFSLFFTRWLQASGSKNVYIAVGGIQLGCMLLSIPMYIYGKRARMWTVRKNFMEKF